MTDSDIISVTNQALSLVLTASLPTVLAAAIGGLLISLLQALTQIQDQGLPNAVKFFAVVGVLFFTYVSLGNEFLSFGDAIFNRIAQL